MLSSDTDRLTYAKITVFWVPLAVMWILMGIEQPALNAVIARLPDATINLAAFGVTFAMALVLESPIIQMLSAATALSRDRQHYRLLVKFMHILAISLSALHFLVGATPLYHFILQNLMGVPEEVIGPSRVAFLIMTPFAAGVGYRRLWQGVLIRHGRTAIIPVTMIARIGVTALFLVIGVFLPINGAAMAATALIAGVISGAVSAGLFALPTIRDAMPDGADPAAGPDSGGLPLSWRGMLSFYVPLSMTSIILLAANPALTAGIARARFPIESLAVWPVISSFMFIFNSVAMSYQEAVIALFERFRAQARELSRFSIFIGVILTALLLIVGLTPLRVLWFHGVSGLEDNLLRFTRIPTLVVSVVPLLLAVKSWLRGAYVLEGRTNVLAQATVIYTVTLLLIVLIVPSVASPVGTVIAAIALVVANLVENIYLGGRFRPLPRRAARRAAVDSLP